MVRLAAAEQIAFHIRIPYLSDADAVYAAGIVLGEPPLCDKGALATIYRICSQLFAFHCVEIDHLKSGGGIHVHAGTGLLAHRVGFVGRRGRARRKIIYRDGGKPKSNRLALAETGLELPPVEEGEVTPRRPPPGDPQLRLLQGLVIDDNRARAVEATVF